MYLETLNKHWCSLCANQLFSSSILDFCPNSSFCYDCYRGILNAKKNFFAISTLLSHSANLEVRRSIYLYSIFEYQTKIKMLVHQSKIKGNPRTIHIIKSLLSEDLTIKRILNQTTQLSVCPSSLWSRYHGKTDLAFFMSEKIKGNLQMSAKRTLYPWYYGHTKRAKLQTKNQNNFRNLSINMEREWEQVRDIENDLKNKTFHVIVDDIFTTGWTALNTINLLESKNAGNLKNDSIYLIICLAKK